ncbi:unnamed protein product [Rhizoctonia solani]|uniref:Transposase family Tnp2 protein n=1 Tax=Rhizoctonia solani TaxID=456999 RepID=A0A8H3E3I4_9AGAM|nr:unnamed protein product [Rhizoctonia solani]
MSATARRFPGTEILVYCSHCDQNLPLSTRNKHLKKYLPKHGSQTSVAIANLNDLDETEESRRTYEEDSQGWDDEEIHGQVIEQLQSNDAVGYGAYESDGNCSDGSEHSNFSRGSWYHIPTPLPSPPRSPPPDRDNDGLSEGEDEFRNIDAMDYREYDRWYSEDHLGEDVEMLAETLTDEEVDSIIMLAVRQFGTVTQSDYERIRYSYRHKLALLTTQRLRTRIAKLSGVEPVEIDCCIEVCHAFTGKYAEETVCSECNQPRYDYKGRPRQIFQYLPATARLQALFNNPDMVRKMLYRAKFVHKNGNMNDVFDSRRYLELCGRNIIIDGVDTGVRHFPGRHDIATAIMTDGIQLFESGSKSNSTCWPIMAQNLNLPPTERAQLRNLIPLGVIPGPNKPKDFDSFLVPFVEECIELAKGVETYNVLTGRTFTLRMHPVIICGDMQAIKFLMNFKGPNGYIPCRECLTAGVYHTERKTYYIPLAQPLPPNSLSSTVQTYDPRNLPLRTDSNTVAQLQRIENAATNKQADDLCKKFGICGPSILDRIPSIARPSSYPHEFMHLFLLNHGPDLISIWIGTHTGVPGRARLISLANWGLIGTETAESTYLLPASYIRPLPNIATSWGLYTAESWSFWIIYIGPVVLRGRLAQKYYDHYLELVSILKCLLSLKNTVARIEQLREDIIHYVETFEELYYKYDYERLGVCRLTLHSLLHVADDVLRCGPVWVAWSFSIERYCREIVGCAKSKVVPYVSINRHILQMSQLAAVASRFPIIRKAMLFGKSDAPVESSRMEHIYDDYPEIVLRFPRLRGFPLNDHVRRRIAQYFRTNFPRWSFHAWLKFIPEHAERWGKLRLPDNGDSIRCAAVVDPLSPYGKRDSSFVRYIFQKDANEDYPGLAPNMVDAYGYGRLDFIIAVTFPISKKFGLVEPELHVLAHITEAKDAEGTAINGCASFTQFGRSIILEVTSVLNVVGRVLTKHCEK